MSYDSTQYSRLHTAALRLYNALALHFYGHDAMPPDVSLLMSDLVIALYARDTTEGIKQAALSALLTTLTQEGNDAVCHNLAVQTAMIQANDALTTIRREGSAKVKAVKAHQPISGALFV